MANYTRQSSLHLHHQSVQEMDFVSQWKPVHRIRILINSEVSFGPCSLSLLKEMKQLSLKSYRHSGRKAGF